jgi:hypothetical protein
MASNPKPEYDTEEFLQSRLEKAIRDTCELHGWAAAISIADPIEILMLFEELESDDPMNFNRKENKS